MSAGGTLPTLPGFKDPFDSAQASTPPQPKPSAAAAAPALPGFTDPFDPAVAAERAQHSTLGDIGRSALGALETGAGEGTQGIGDVVKNGQPVLAQ